VVVLLRVESSRQHVAHPNIKRVVFKYLWEIKKNDVDKSQLFECKMYMAVVKCHIK
jgi:hypothetical protein